MVADFSTSLLIALIGMGLIFGAIVLFWLLTRILVRITSSRAGSKVVTEVSSDEDAERDLKQRAALVAVTIALASEADEGPKPFPVPPTALVSTWQAVRRANQLGQRGAVR